MKNFDKDSLIEFIILALKRSLWTFAEVALSMMTFGMAFTSIDWKVVFDVALGAAIYSVLKSIVVSMPEFGSEGELTISDTECNVRLNINQEEVNNKKSIRLKVIPDTTKTA